MEPAVEVVLTGVLFSQFTARATLETRVLRGFKSSRKPVSQAEASPQQAEFLAAAVRPILASLSLIAIFGGTVRRQRCVRAGDGKG